ncbi:hypothetical protein [Mucilaginibacter sp. FT3.2]|uniref:hypothetical protein n=1 Tax=Mucilaginibacter sp. FT3.2 TaxID=2723090 RepID=UPI003B009A96
MKSGENKIKDVPYSPRFKSYSIDEILAAGGPTAFATKMGKDPRGIEEELSKLPPECFLTEEEFNEAMAILNASK